MSRVIWCAAVALVTVALLGPAATIASADVVTSPEEVSVVPFPPEALPSAPAEPNLILNGDFENTTMSPGCHFNLDNATVTAGLANITAFGDASEIDIMSDGTSCGYAGPPQSGVVKLSLHRQGIAGPVDAFSFDLSSALTAGETYTIEFYVWADRTYDPDLGRMEVGISSSATSFGTLVYTSDVPSETSWTHMSGSFVAGFAATYLTVQVESNADAWNHIDNFILEEENGSPTEDLAWGMIKALYR
jgi:hypothetical protein